MCSKQINIKAQYFEEIEKIVEHSSLFKTPDDYVNFILNELLFERENDISQQENNEINKRLKDLGYL